MAAWHRGFRLDRGSPRAARLRWTSGPFRRHRMPDTRSHADSRALSPPWFERIGASGFAGLGATVGLAISLLLVSSAAREAPAAPDQVAPRTAVHVSAPGASPAPSPPMPQPVPTPAEALTQLPAPAPPPRAPLLVPAPAAPPATVASVTAVPDTATLEPSERSSASTCGYITASGEPCRNPVSRGGYCYLHRAPDPTPSYSGSTGGTVHVRGYYRKNGTYVRPHTRSAPRRR